LSARPTNENVRPVSVVRESVPIAQRYNRLGAAAHGLAVAAHLVEKRGVREGKSLAVHVIATLRERDGSLGMS
jgi:hypothetical protein